MKDYSVLNFIEKSNVVRDGKIPAHPSIANQELHIF